MIDPIKELVLGNWYYETAKQEMESGLPPDVSMWTEREWRIWSIAMWLRGATWRKENPDA